MAYNDPLLFIVNKIKEDNEVRKLLPSFHNVFSGSMPKKPVTPSVYVFRHIGEESPILTFDRKRNPILLSNNTIFKLSSLHNLSIEHSKELGYTACNSILPSIVEAGLFSLKYSYDESFKDESFPNTIYRSNFTISCLSQRTII